MGTSVVGAAALDLDGLEVGVQVDLDPGPVALGQLDVVDGTWDVGLALDLAHGCAGEGGQGGSPCPLDPGTGQACGAVLACRGPAVVVAVAGAVLARPGAAVVAGGVVGAVGAGAGPVVEERGGGGGGHACRAAVAHRAGDPDAPDEEHQPCRGSGDPLAAQSHRPASCAVLGGSRGDSPPPRAPSRSRCRDATDQGICG